MHKTLVDVRGLFKANIPDSDVCSFAYSVQWICLYNSTTLQKERPDDSYRKEQNFEEQVLKIETFNTTLF